MYGIDVSDELAKILPQEDKSDENKTTNSA